VCGFCSPLLLLLLTAALNIQSKVHGTDSTTSSLLQTLTHARATFTGMHALPLLLLSAGRNTSRNGNL
jgi:hypothetical protein